MHDLLRCIYCSDKRHSGQLYELPGERIDMPADMQLRVHSLWDKLLHGRDSDCGDVHTLPNSTATAAFSTGTTAIHG